MHLPFLAIAVFSSLGTVAGTSWADPFDGKWEIDLRTPAEVRANAECGIAGFSLVQHGQQITGSHWLYTTGCGRMNEGGDETVVGTASGRKAMLTVTSMRTGAVVVGQARLVGTALRWETLKEIKAGELGGESSLILYSGQLKKAKED
jgi:hypothetical protein